MNNTLLTITFIVIVVSALAAATIVGIKLRRALWKIHTQLDGLQTRLNTATRRIGQISTAVDVTARETQNAVFLTQIGLRFPVFFGGWSVDTFLGKFLVQHLVEFRPTTILELGSGSSTTLIARTLQAMGINDSTHIAVDHESKYLGISKDYARLNGVEERVIWLDCPLQHFQEFDKLWYGGLTEKLAGRKIDLLIIDGPPAPLQPMSRYPALPLLLPFMSEHCTIVLDDAIRDEEQEIARRWVAENPMFSIELLLDGHGMAVLSR